MRLAVISIEFSAGTFSGNGVYSTSQVRALANLGHQVLVIAGRPAAYSHGPNACGAFSLLEVELPIWGRLDRECAWQEFAEGAATLTEQLAVFDAQAVLGVDWTSLRAYQALAAGLASRGNAAPPYVFMSYRVHLRSAGQNDRPFLRSMEAEAAAAAALTTVLSRSDAEYLAEHLCVGNSPVKVLLPALRTDLAQLPLPADAVPVRPGAGAESACALASPRRLLTCAVRLSPEKDPLRFVDVVECLAAKGAFEQLQVTPLLLGAAQTPFACELRARFRASTPWARVEERFLNAADLAEIYAQTRLNCHFCTYDAFGMTVVEAASQGAPSVFNGGGAVGAGDLLSAARGEALELDMSQPVDVIAGEVLALLSDPALLAKVGAAAAAWARSWTEDANAAALAIMIADVLR